MSRNREYNIKCIRPLPTARGSDPAVFAIRLVENHVAPERLAIDQVKALEKSGDAWLGANGELEGNLDSVISVRRRPERKAAGEVAT